MTEKITEQQKNDILDAVRSAGRGLLAAHDIESHMKVKPGDANFATVWDVETQRVLCSRLHEIIPEAGFLAEEDAENDSDAYAERANANDDAITFIVDPIDGTTNFIHGLSHSAVSVAVSACGSPVFGCVYNPYLDEMFYASKGGGAYLCKNGVTASIHVSDRTLDRALCAFGTSPYERSRADVTFELAKRMFLSCREVRREGSAALDICYVAAGRYDVYFELHICPWDFAAALLILTEAGGMMTALDGSPVDDRRPTSAFASNIACRPAAAAILSTQI